MLRPATGTSRAVAVVLSTTAMLLAVAWVEAHARQTTTERAYCLSPIQTPCPTKGAECEQGATQYCTTNGINRPGFCNSSPDQACTDFGVKSCGAYVFCSNGMDTTRPPTTCTETVRPCKTLPRDYP